jgi:hypothetical protein
MKEGPKHDQSSITLWKIPIGKIFIFFSFLFFMIKKKDWELDLWELVLKTDCSQMSETWISWELDYIIYLKILKLGRH